MDREEGALVSGRRRFIDAHGEVVRRYEIDLRLVARSEDAQPWTFEGDRLVLFRARRFALEAFQPREQRACPRR
jgi:hypothetical protein